MYIAIGLDNSLEKTKSLDEAEDFPDLTLSCMTKSLDEADVFF